MPPSSSTTIIAPLASKLAFVDVETTGASPGRSSITEIAIVTVRCPWPHAGPPLVEQWSSLVSPGHAIPPEIRFLTGIDADMLVDAPTFAELADTIASRLEDTLFVAHHARFDYGFVKTEMQRAGKTFQSRTLCTVRLSRALYPSRSAHTLDDIILDNKLPGLQRHRAGGDAQALWQFMLVALREHGCARVFDTARELISRPNLPAHLNVSSLESLPAGAGIYFFHGLNEHPLYIGKSINLRQRVASHFCTDYMSARGIRLASEIRRLSWIETPGEFSALLAEIQAIEQHQPAHNRALRAQANPWFVSFEDDSPVPAFGQLATLNDIGNTLGPFASRSAARERLIKLAREHGWCLAAMALERHEPGAPCFARQLRRCQGCCVGAESAAALYARIKADLQTSLVPGWPSARLLITEEDEKRQLFEWHVFDRWHWLDSGDDPESLRAGVGQLKGKNAHAGARFNRHVHDLLTRTLRKSPAQPFPGQSESGAPQALPARVPTTKSKAWKSRRKGDTRLRWCWIARDTATIARAPAAPVR